MSVILNKFETQQVFSFITFILNTICYQNTSMQEM